MDVSNAPLANTDAEFAVSKAPFAYKLAEFASVKPEFALTNAPFANVPAESIEVFCEEPSANFNGFATKFTPSVEIFT